MGNYTAPTAIVREDVILGRDSKVWHFCNIYGCKIGDNSQVGSYSEVKSGVVIGDNCRIQPYVFIPEGTHIGNNVFIGPRVTFLNDKFPTARKAIEGTWTLDSVVVEDDVTLGGNVTINPGVKIGRGSFIGAGSVVTRDVPEYSVAWGNPARVHGDARTEPYTSKLKSERAKA